MLSTRERLAARQGQSGTPRHEYLQALVSEYARSPHWLRKEEIVAHLGNFAYDPINYGALQRLRVMELFVEIVTSYGDVCPPHTQDQDQHDGRAARDEHFERRRREESASAARSKALLVEFAMGGICNCVPDPSLQLAFIESGGVPAVLKRVEAVSVDSFHDVAAVGDATSDQERRQLEAERCAFNTALSALTIVYFLLDSPALESVSTDSILAHIQELSRHVNVRIANVAKAFLSRYEELLASIEHS